MTTDLRGVLLALGTACALIGCSEQSTERIAGNVDDWNWRPPVFNSGCNGFNGSQLRVSLDGLRGLAARASAFGGPQRLERVVVYGTPVQRPSRGYGDLATYGGMTNVFIYDRNILDQCTFGDGRPYTVVGPEADDTLDVISEPPEGVEQATWEAITPRVRKQLRVAAWYLADHWIPNDLPGIGLLTLQARRGLIFQSLANAYQHALSVAPDRRQETVMFMQSQRGSTYRFSDQELLRIDALLIGCATSQKFRAMDSWNASQAQDYASRVAAGWAADQTQSAGKYWMEPQLTRLGALGAELGREGNSCGQAARYHFENTTRDLFDSPSGGGNEDNQF